MLERLIIRWFINAVAIFAAVYLVPGIEVIGNRWETIAAMALLLGLVNALVRPILKWLTCPLIILTLGLFTLVINALTFWLAAWIGRQFDIGFVVGGFWPAFFGALVISVVSLIMTIFVGEDPDRRRRKRRKR